MQAARLEAEKKEKDIREREDRAIAREATRPSEEMDEKARDRDLQVVEKDKERQFQMERDRADREQKAKMARHEASETEKDQQLEANKLAVEENKIRLEREKLEAGTTRVEMRQKGEMELEDQR